jgi:RimJ/RimL family protein N-acetyltransferase
MSGAAVPDAGDGLASPRLVLRRFTPADLSLLIELNSDPEVMRYLGGVITPRQTAAMLEGRILEYYRANPGLGVWATVRREDGECIGFHQLNHIYGESVIQLGYRLFPRYWGQGYATEMSLTLLRSGYTQLELPCIGAMTALDNRSSQQVLLKAGLPRRGERNFSHPAYANWGPLAWFERSAPEWLAEYSPNLAAIEQ